MAYSADLLQVVQVKKCSKFLYRDIQNKYGYIQLQHRPDSKKREGTAAVRMRCIIVDIAYLYILVHTFEYLRIAQGGKRHCILVDSREPKPKEAKLRIAQALGGKSRRALARPPDEESEAGPSLPELLRGIWGNSPSRVLLAQCTVQCVERTPTSDEVSQCNTLFSAECTHHVLDALVLLCTGH